ncbi:unnamed protein product [Sphagnum tenellum]
MSDDKKWLYISIYVDEGDPYRIGFVDFGGDLLFNKFELGESLSLNSGDLFGITKRNNDIQHLTEKYQDLGYAFVNVIPKMAFHDEQKTVDLEYHFEKGNLVHFGEINILGNSKTYDNVIRRELKIREGELYNGTNLRISKENVERLGYFAQGEVLFNTVSPKGRKDILDLEITVKERSTGTITLGAGYGSVQELYPVDGLNVDPNDSGLLSSVTFSAVRDKRNNRFETMGDLVFRNSTELGEIAGGAVPASQKFYLGGPNNMKGFPQFSLGPRQMAIVNNNPVRDLQGNPIYNPLGGAVEAYSLFELEYPLLKDAGIKAVIFFDVGNAANTWAGGDLFPLRTDAGFGFRWFSPIGPLRFEWGYPLYVLQGEQSSTFSFFIGPPF